MYCSNCGKKIDIDSKFCHFCGAQIEKDSIEAEAESTSTEEKVPTKSTGSDLLWEKFAEVYDARDEEREKFNELSSEIIWELIERLYTNSFETFIQEHKKELNSQPFKAIESLKNLYLYSVLGGYRFWIAEALLNDKPLGKFKSFDIDMFVKEWKEYDFSKAMKNISDDMSVCMSMYLEHRMNGLLESTPSIKEVSNATMEELRNSITFQIINGYNAGTLENTFRK